MDCRFFGGTLEASNGGPAAAFCVNLVVDPSRASGENEVLADVLTAEAKNAESASEDACLILKPPSRIGRLA